MKLFSKLALVLICMAVVPSGLSATCTLQSASIVFGSYDGSQTVSAVGNISFYCDATGGMAVAVRLSTGGSGTYTTRKMTGPGGALNYNLYTDATYSKIWGDGSKGTSQVTQTFTSAGTVNVPVYGRIPAGQASATSGYYVDTLTVTYAFDATLHNFTNNGSMTVSTGVTTTCTITAAPMNFGNLGLPLATTSSSQTATLTYTCSLGAAAKITLDQGQNGTGTPAAPVRRMKVGTNYLGYQLYSNSGRTAVWDGVTGVSVTGTGSPQTSTVYGLVPAQTVPPAGSYTDVVVVTMTF